MTPAAGGFMLPAMARAIPHLRSPALAMLFVLALLARPAAACLWDEDTAYAEARGLPEVVEVIAGRFERNPPLYYEMRLARARGRVERDPRDLPAYDDAGVACDRLGRGDEAIAWMGRKKAALEGMPAGDAQAKEHRYRYLANLGTFHVHRWARNGAKRDDLADAKLSRELIAEAIKLNPKAHFGRERYQLLAIDAMIAGREVEDHQLPTFLDKQNDRALHRCSETQANDRLAKMGYADAAQGLAGLIALGNAWESVDVFWALTLVLQCDGRSSIADLASLRTHELVENGKHSMLLDASKQANLGEWLLRRGDHAPDHDALKAYYKAARESADRWHEKRQAFMLSKLSAGKHPDTDADFWRGFDGGKPPPLPGSGYWGLESFVKMYPVLAVLVGLIGMAVLLKLVMRWARG